MSDPTAPVWLDPDGEALVHDMTEALAARDAATVRRLLPVMAERMAVLSVEVALLEDAAE